MNRFRILIADDNDPLRSLIVRLLKESTNDLEVVGEASDGYAAIEMTRQLMPDAVIMDIQMPHMDGLEASRAIHAEFPNISVIGLSMFDRSELGDEMLKAGAVSYFSKDMPWDEILAGIRNTLAGEPQAVA